MFILLYGVKNRSTIFFPVTIQLSQYHFFVSSIPAAAIFNTLYSMISFCMYVGLFWTFYSISLTWICMHQYFIILLLITLIIVDYLNFFIESPYSPSPVNP